MSITIVSDAHVYGRIAILRPASALDWSSYRRLITDARAAHAAGARNLIVDLRRVTHIGPAGFVALYSVACLAQGVTPPDIEQGWTALHALTNGAPLLRPLLVIRPDATALRETLKHPPLSDFLAPYSDLDAALAMDASSDEIHAAALARSA